VIIPPREEEEGEEEEEDTQYQNGEAGEQGQDYAVALYDFTAAGEDEMTVQAREQLVILEKDGDEWWKCRNLRNEEGVVPASYLEVSISLFVILRILIHVGNYTTYERAFATCATKRRC